MQPLEEPRTRCSQRDYSLLFKLAVVGEVGRGELSYKQVQWRYGIQGRSTVLTCAGTMPAISCLSSRPGPPAKQLQEVADRKLLLRTMLQVEDHGIPLPKKSFRRPSPGWKLKKD